MPSHLNFSIVIPTRDRPANLAHCLKAIARLGYPPDCFEVVVVDDGSDPSLENLVSGVREQINLVFLRQPPRGPAAARNFGAAHARGKYLVFTDDDCRPDHGWLNALEACLARAQNCMVAGYVQNLASNNSYSSATQKLIEYLNSYYNIEESDAHFITSNNIAMPRHLFLAIGGFDGTFRFAAGEDREFCDRWRHHGLQVIYRSDSVVTHAHFLSFRSYCRQHFNYGRGGYHFHHLQAQRNSSAAKFESPSFYWNLIIHPWTATAPVRSVKLVALMIVSQIANALGYFYEAALHELSLKRMRHSGQG